MDAHLHRGKLLNCRTNIHRIATQPVEFGDNQDVALLKPVDELVKAFSLHGRRGARNRFSDHSPGLELKTRTVWGRRCPQKRWDNWYDPELVTAKGEKIQAELDTWAIKELRKHKLSGNHGAAAPLSIVPTIIRCPTLLTACA